MIKLIIEDDEGKTTVVPLIRDEITIGRKEGNTIRLTERNVSRRHARLLRQDGEVFIEDLTSYNGIRLNGVRIGARTPLGEGDQVVIGDYKLAVKLDRPAVVAPPLVIASPGVPAAAMRTTVLGVPAPTLTPPLGVPESMSSEHPTAPNLRPLTSLTPLTLQSVVPPPPVAAPPPPTAAVPLAPITNPGYTGLAPLVPSSPPAMPAPQIVITVPPPAVQQSFVTATAPPSPAPSPPLPPVPVAEPAIPSTPLEGAPTIPVRTFESQETVAAGPPARLVALTTDLAGAEYVLDRASMVIGRTGENDIVLNHKSISRHHAKIVRDGERYTVVDLQSANGVRVNGEEYDRIELGPGDVIELGHLRLRFVGGRESFVFDPSLARTGRRVPGRSVMLLAGSAALVAVLGIALMRGGQEAPKSKLVESKPPPPAAEPSRPEPVRSPDPVAVAAPVPPPPTPSPSAPAGPTKEALFAEASMAVKAERWDDALAALSQLADRGPVDAAAQELRQKAEGERKNADLYARFKASTDRKEYEQAVVAFTEITVGSVYKEKGRRDFQQVKGRFIAKHLDIAERLRAQGKCPEVRQEVDLILAVDERNRLAQEVVKLCKPRSAAPGQFAAAVVKERKEPAPRPARPDPPRPAPPPRTVAAASPPATPKPPPSSPAADDSAGDPQGLLKQAREAWLRGQHASAIESAKKALKVRPGLTDAYQIIAVASCSLRDSDGAGRAYARLDDKTKSMVRGLCQRNGVSLE